MPRLAHAIMCEDDVEQYRSDYPRSRVAKPAKVRVYPHPSLIPSIIDRQAEEKRARDYAEFVELAKKYPPPQSWFDEDFSGVWGPNK